MVKPEILRKQIALIKKTKAEREEQKKLEAELTELRRGEKSSTFQQKHRKKIAIVRGAGTGLSRIGRGLGIMFKGGVKRMRESEGLKRQYAEMYGPKKPKKRIAVVKKKKSKKQVKEKYIIRGGRAYPVVAVIKKKKR